MDFAVPADHGVKLKELWKEGISTSTLLENWKKMWNIKLAIIPIEIGSFGTVIKGLVQGLEDAGITGWVETLQTTALLTSARILRSVLETRGNLLSLKLQWETIR